MTHMNLLAANSEAFPLLAQLNRAHGHMRAAFRLALQCLFDQRAREIGCAPWRPFE